MLAEGLAQDSCIKKHFPCLYQSRLRGKNGQSKLILRLCRDLPLCMVRVCNLPYLCSGFSNRTLTSTLRQLLPCQQSPLPSPGVIRLVACILYINWPFPVAMHVSNIGTSERKTRARHFMSFLEGGDPS